MKPFIVLIIITFLLKSCVKTASTKIKIGQAEIACQIEEKKLIPEGINHSSKTQSFYLGSILKT